MTETSHRPHATPEMHRIDPQEARLAYDEAVARIEESLHDNDGLQIQNTDSLPRMTPALTEALQNFTLDSKIPAEKAHGKALKEYRKISRDEYSAHIYDMAQGEANGDYDTGRTYRNALLRENLQTTVEEKLESTSIRARELGRVALDRTSDITSRLLETGKDKLDEKIYNVKSKRAYKKHMTELQKDAIKVNKQFDKNARRTSRKERKEAFLNPKLEKARRIGSFAIQAQEKTSAFINPEKYAEKQQIKKSAEFATALNSYDFDKQLPAVQELAQEDLFKPKELISSGAEQGFISEMFTTAENPNKFSAIFYESTNEGTLIPQLLDYDSSTETWKRRDELLPDGYQRWSSSDRQVYEAATNTLNQHEDANIITADQLDAVLTKLSFKKPVFVYEGKNPDKSSEHRIKADVYREKREALIKAKKLAAERDAQKRAAAAQAMKKVATASRKSAGSHNQAA